MVAGFLLFSKQNVLEGGKHKNMQDKRPVGILFKSSKFSTLLLFL